MTLTEGNACFVVRHNLAHGTRHRNRQDANASLTDTQPKKQWSRMIMIRHRMYRIEA